MLLLRAVSPDSGVCFPLGRRISSPHFSGGVARDWVASCPADVLYYASRRPPRREPRGTFRHAQYLINHRLDLEEIEWQVTELAKAGYHGPYAHARQGLLTPYMSEAWWRDPGCRLGCSGW